MADKNYYAVLGVSDSASTADIKKSYRKLVRKYHPDVSKEADADAKMAEINQAYEVLKDDEKRKEYDSYLNSPFAGQQPFQPGQDYENFANQFHRNSHTGQGGFSSGSHAGGFGGNGFEGFSSGGGSFRFDDLFGAFQEAQGNGRRQTHTQGEDQHAELTIDIAAAYTGAERSLSLNMPTVKDGQLVSEVKTLNVKIPKGIAEGQQIRLSGQGMPSLYANPDGSTAGKAGDLYLKIRFSESDALHVQGKDVYQQVAIAPWEAALGGDITVNTPAGKLNVKVPANTASGKRLRLKGKGIPSKDAGDLYLELRISLPKAETDADHAAWEQLSKHYAAYTPAR